jgi:gluconolactonase
MARKQLCAALVSMFLSIPLAGQVQKVAEGFQFVEGPLWKDGVGLLFSDINGNTIYRWSQDSGVAVYLRPSGGSNGLAFDLQGRLLAALQGNRQVVRIEQNGTRTVLASLYQGKRLNSPNDLVVKSDGSIWFTDPPYGISSSQEELHFCGIYRISTSGDLQLLDKTLTRPNGIAFSPDEAKLYVNDSEVRVISAWDIVSDSTIANKRSFAAIAPVGYADGMKVDAAGNIFSAGPLGIWVFAPDGHVLDTILVPGQTTNCNWGDSDRKTLYITSGTAVYKTRPAITGMHDPGNEGLIEPGFGLLENFPNPFNPSTTIRYGLPRKSEVQLEVYNALGQHAALLVRGEQEAGYHEVKFDAGPNGGQGSRLATGVYLCRLQARQLEGGQSREVIQTRKFLLLR